MTQTPPRSLFCRSPSARCSLSRCRRRRSPRARASSRAASSSRCAIRPSRRSRRTTYVSPAPSSSRCRSTATSCSCSPTTSSYFQDRGTARRSRATSLFVSRHEPDLRRAAGVQHQDADRHVLQRVRHRDHAAGHARNSRRRAGTLRVFLGRRTAQGRADEVQDRPRRLHRLRAADAALGGLVRIADAQPRRLRPADERAVQGQGRSAAVPAGLLLPDGGRRPVDRLPHADLRHGDARRADS